jgi:hypothetical protein
MAEQNENSKSATPPDEDGQGAPSTGEVSQLLKERTMIETHAPQEPVTNWKDYLIHISIVTIGLLIAIGLEQTVEYYHHRHQVAETREALKVEREYNILRFQSETEEMRHFVPLLKMNLAVFQYLRKNPGAAPEKWPGKLHLYTLTSPFTDAEWRTAQGSGVLQFMPQDEVRKLTNDYNDLKNLNDLFTARMDMKRESFRYFIQENDASNFTLEQLDRSIDLTTETILLYSKEANMMSKFVRSNADFTGGPTVDDYNAILQFSSSIDDRKDVQEEIDKRNKREKEHGFATGGNEPLPAK